MDLCAPYTCTQKCFGCEGMPSLSRFALASFVNIRRENILKLFQKYDTNGLDPKEFMDEIKLNMI